MPDRYATEFVGVKDGTKSPPDRSNHIFVGAKVRRIRATKQVLADAIADRIFIGTIPQGGHLAQIRITTDTSLGTSTLAIGTTATPAKYRAAGVFTTPLDVPTTIGPRASALDDAVLTADEDVWVTVGVAALPVGAIVVFELEYTIAN